MLSRNCWRLLEATWGNGKNKNKDKEEDKSFSNIRQYNPRQSILMITVKKVLTFIFYVITILFDIFNNRTFRDHPYQKLNSIDYI
ncbi:MAG TPA: hypothetical protein VFI70_11285 [Nitrososphaeraceae archaeon]|nr:hypothetical protein [Nitrososphaeraceae archaeon]